MKATSPVTLLGLAIGASVAVVPVLLFVLLIVVMPRGADDPKPSPNSDRHSSVRQVAALKTFEYAIVARERIKTPSPSADELLARFPQCRGEWMERKPLLGRIRAALSLHTESGTSPPAEQGGSAAARMARQLTEIDRALLSFSTAENRRVADKVGLDGTRWLEAVAMTLDRSVESPDYPGRKFLVRCGDIVSAVTTLARSNSRMLDALAWRGTEVERVVARWRADQYVEISARHVARANPWAGIPGCTYLNHSRESAGPMYFVSSSRGVEDGLCNRHEMRGDTGRESQAFRIGGEPTPDIPFSDPRWKVPPSLSAMLQPLEALHRPTGTLYREYTGAATSAPNGHGPNRIDLRNNQVDVGFSIDLTIDPESQALAQRTVACYTGRSDVCQALGVQRKEDGAQGVGHAMLEHAMVRMAAVAIIDVASGRIEALAGALSPCTRQEYDGPGRSSTCDRRIPYPIRFRPDALLNPAVFHDAMPASTIKPIMAAAFLSNPDVGARLLSEEQRDIARSAVAIPAAQSLRGQLMRSDSARFLDRMFCSDKGFSSCSRPWAIQATATAVGWNSNCASPREDCGKRDLLFGAEIERQGASGPDSLALMVPYGRLLTEPLGGDVAAPFRLRREIALDSARVRRCAAGPDGRWPSKDDWEKCSGGVVVDVVAEGWGQGHARASALGGAGMMAVLAAAANGQQSGHPPHLVEAIRGTLGQDALNGKPPIVRSGEIETSPNRISRDAAQVILNGLSFGHRAGTSRLACEQIFEARKCASIDWIAGKTGTPTFPNDDRSLDELARLCNSPAQKNARERAACGPLRPYKWYLATYRTDRNNPGWTKVIGVLTERNWLTDTGRVHGAGDHGPNPAAEIAMQIAARQAGYLPWSEH